MFSNGDYYNGNFKNGLFEGYGEYFYKHQNIIYKGEWREGKQEGRGILQFSNGTMIESHWSNGNASRNGRILYYNGDVYEGNLNGVGPNGRGTYRRKTGESIEGDFKNGVMISNWGWLFFYVF